MLIIEVARGVGWLHSEMSWSRQLCHVDWCSHLTGGCGDRSPSVLTPQCLFWADLWQCHHYKWPYITQAAKTTQICFCFHTSQKHIPNCFIFLYNQMCFQMKVIFSYVFYSTHCLFAEIFFFVMAQQLQKYSTLLCITMVQTNKSHQTHRENLQLLSYVVCPVISKHNRVYIHQYR